MHIFAIKQIGNMQSIIKHLLLWMVAAIAIPANADNIEPRIISSGFGENLATGCPRLQVIGDMLYAPGPDGIMRHAEGEAAVWEPFAMQGINVIDFRISGDDIIAFIVPDEYSQITDMDLRSVARLVKGTVSGTEFRDITPAEMEYTYRGYILTSLSAMAQHATDKNRMMIMGHGGIMQSEDFGETWEKLTNSGAVYNAHSFLGWHPQNPDILFLTSESLINVGMVCRSMDGGKTWEVFEPEPNNESCCHCIAFDPDNADHLLISGEYAIYESFDCGETWEKVLDDINKSENSILGYAYNIMYDPTDSSKATIYAVGHANGGPARNIVRSTDNGKSWQQCMKYDFEEEWNFFYDAALFDGKIWIYDYKDIAYWNIAGSSGMENPSMENPQPAIYYDMKGIRLGSRPSSGIVIEKRGETSKVIAL